MPKRVSSIQRGYHELFVVDVVYACCSFCIGSTSVLHLRYIEHSRIVTDKYIVGKLMNFEEYEKR